MNMKKIKLLGVAGSLHLNKKNQYFSALYFDEPIMTIHDYESGQVKNKFKVNHLTPYTNILSSNDDYLVFLSNVYTLSIVETKNFTVIQDVQLQNAGVIHFTQIKENKLYVFTGLSRAVNADEKRDIFVIDLQTFNVEAFYSGKIIANCKNIGDELFVVADNYGIHSTYAVMNFNSKNSLDFDGSVDEVIFLEKPQHAQSLFAILNEFEYGSLSKLIEIDHHLSIKEVERDTNIVGGYIDTNQKILLTFNNDKYYIDNGLKKEKLGFSTITGAFDSNEEFFCFGADKYAVFINI